MISFLCIACDTHSIPLPLYYHHLSQVNDYPFTTRGVTVGHIVDVDLGKRYQVMDTPGTIALLRVLGLV